MKAELALFAALLSFATIASAEPAKVNALNFARAEADMYFARFVAQAGSGKFEVPEWDKETHEKAREALISLSALGGTKENRFGKKEDVDTISWLIGSAVGWGGNPPKDAIYLPGYPPQNDGKTAYEVTIKDVPVDGFWSFTIYDAKGFMFENEQKAWSVNNVTARRAADGSVKIRFGGDPQGADNYLAILPGWNYVLRLYRPRKEILNGTWEAPELQPVK